MAKPKPEPRRTTGVRCAIYTRKSTEEGLDQVFNSLDAQREACAAYILSQKHEGWVPVRDQYDDGGFSGGNMDRPGLKRLLADVEAGRVDVIVVYKVDRLTRALSDFAKIVEVLDARGASFVSITQAFNTTTSMGRLTLNVLLSFAQFEREVTGERIRDKIAASKKKGLWMGGNIPLGYAVRDRQLIVDEADAATVRHLFTRYLALGSGSALLEELRAQGYRTKVRALSDGSTRGGVPFSRGPLFHLLANRIYIGAIVHKGEANPGAHPPIIDQALWDAVQQRIASNAVERTERRNVRHASLLAGILVDFEDRRMSPSHASKAGKRYRYYITHASELGNGGPPPARVAAHDIETIAVARIRKLLDARSEIRKLVQPVDASAAALQLALAQATTLAGRLAASEQRRTIIGAIVQRVRLLDDRVELELDRTALLKLLSVDGDSTDAPLLLSAPSCRVRHGNEVRLMLADDDGRAERNPPLAAVIAEAHAIRSLVLSSPDETADQIAKRLGRCRSRLAKLLRISFLAPDIVTAVVDGIPTTFGVRELIQQALPSGWDDQRALLRVA